MVSSILLFSVGLIIGFSVMWLIRRGTIRQLRDQIRAEEAGQVQAERATLIERIQARELQLQDVKNMLEQKETHIASLEIANQTLLLTHKELETQLSTELSTIKERLNGCEIQLQKAEILLTEKENSIAALRTEKFTLGKQLSELDTPTCCATSFSPSLR